MCLTRWPCRPYGFLPPVRTVVPVPICFRAPVPLMEPPNVTVSVRLKASTPWFVTLPVRLPVVPPAPTCNVPDSMRVPPVYVFTPVRTSVLGLTCRRPPVPLIAPSNVTESARLNASTPLVVTLPTMLPSRPPSPICRVPAVIIVPPEYVFAPVNAVIPAPACSRAPVPLITPLNVGRVGSVERKHAIVGHITGMLPVVPPSPRTQATGADCRAAGVRVRSRQRRRPGTHLNDSAGAADLPIHRERIAAIEREYAVIDDVACTQSSGRASITNLQVAGVIECRPAIGVRPGQRQRRHAGLR